MISDNSEIKEFIKKYLLSSKYATKETSLVKELLKHLIGTTSKMNILGVYGSAMEGGMFSVFNFNSSGDYEFDFDLMIGFGPQPLNQPQQKVAFRHLADNPGHLNIDITQLSNWEIDERYLNIKSGNVYISGLEVKKGFAFSKLTSFLRNLQIDIDPVNESHGKASVSLNIAINTTKTLSMEPDWRKFYDKMVTISDKDEQDQRRLDKLWQEIKFDNLFKKIRLHIDLVPSLECESWPVIAEDWKTRDRFWLPRSLVNEIIQGGYHVVAKASPGGDPNLEWRISFSKAELTLAENRNMVQKKCYYIFKTMFKEYLGQSGVISTYYLKTIMMWAIEQNPVEYWREDNIGQVVLGLLDHLYKAVVTGNLPHYFIPQNNLLKHFPCDVLEKEADDILLFRQSVTKINRQEPILLSSNAIGTEYESLMRVSRKGFKQYHARYIEFLCKTSLSCFEENIKNCEILTDHSPQKQAETLNDERCTYPKYDILGEYLVAEYRMESILALKSS